MKALLWSFHTLVDVAHVVPNHLTSSFSHLILGLAMSLLPSSGIYSIICLAHWLSVILATCPTKHHQFLILACTSVSCILTSDILQAQALCLWFQWCQALLVPYSFVLFLTNLAFSVMDQVGHPYNMAASIHWWNTFHFRHIGILLFITLLYFAICKCTPS